MLSIGAPSFLGRGGGGGGGGVGPDEGEGRRWAGLPGEGAGGGAPLPPSKGVWGSAVSSHIGVWGGAPEANAIALKDSENYARKARPFMIKAVPYNVRKRLLQPW